MIVRFDDIKTDINGNIEPPILFLQSLAKEPITPISNYYNLECNFKYNDVSEISFSVPDKFVDDDEIVKNPSYDEVRGMRIVRMEPFGSFILINPSITDDGIKKIKSCKAYSLEYELNYKTMPRLEDTYMFYDPTGEAEDTMMNIVLECVPNWKIGHIDANVATRYRTFDNGSEAVYSFMMNTLQKSYNCIFLFDTDSRTINVYDSKMAIKNIPMFLSNLNLISNLEATELSDELVTSLAVYGADDLSIMSVNPLASDKIYNLDYFIGIGDIPKKIADKWKAWKNSFSVYQKMFVYLFSDFYTAQLLYNAESTKLVGLEDELETMQHIMDTYETDHTGDHAAEMEDLKKQMAAKKAEISAQEEKTKAAENKVDTIEKSMEEISKQCSFENSFTAEELNILNVFIKEDSIQDSTYVVSYTADNPALCEDVSDSNPFAIEINKANLYRTDEYKDLTDEEIKDLGATSENLEAILQIQKEISSTHLGYNFFTINSGSISITNADSSLGISGAIVNSTLSYKDEDNEDKSHDCMVTFYIDSPKITGIEDKGSTTALFVVSGKLTDFQYNNIINSDNQDTMSFKLIDGVLTFTYDSTIYQRQSTVQELYDFGVDSLNKLAYPSYDFSIDSANFMMLPEFEMFRKDIKLGRSMNIEFKDGVYLQPILIGVQLNFEDPSSFSLEFSDKFQSNNPEFLLADVIGKSAQTAANLDSNKFSYSAFVNSNVQNDVEELISSALDVSKKNIINSVNQDILINGSGIHLRKLIDRANNRFDPCEVRMINNEIVFTDDSWETAGLAIGKLTVGEGSDARSFMGIVANSLIGNVIIGNKLTIEATGVDQITGQPNVTHFRVDGSGAFLGNAGFAMQGAPQNGIDGNQILLDPRYGVVMGDRTLFNFGSAGVDVNFLDEKGNVIYDKTGVMPAGSSLFFDIKTGMASFRGDVYAENGYFKGKVEATSGIFKGALDIGDNFKVDENGNLVCKNAKVEGTVTATDGEFTGIIHAKSGEFTGDITANNLTVKNNARVSGLEVGKNVIMGPDAVISWGNLPNNVASDGQIDNLQNQINNLPAGMTPDEVTQITANAIKTGKLILAGNIYRLNSTAADTNLMVGINSSKNFQMGVPSSTGYSNMNLYSGGQINFISASSAGDTSENYTLRVGNGVVISQAPLTVWGNIDIHGQATISSRTDLNGQLWCSDARTFTVTNGKSVFVGEQGRFGVSGSTRKIKHDIVPLMDDDLSADKLYSIPVVQFKFNQDIVSPEDRFYERFVPGLIAEDVAQIYPVAAVLDNGEPSDWDFRYLIPPMLKLIQEQKKEINQLRADIDELKGVKL